MPRRWNGEAPLAQAAQAESLGRHRGRFLEGNRDSKHYWLLSRHLKGAKGLIAAYDLATGNELWSKDITAAVVGCAALADGAAVVTATDGKVRAFDIENGERRWIYDSKIGYFGPAAIAGNTVYAGDFKGALHAIDLKSGARKWLLDLGTAPETQAPGMVYGGPVVSGGRIYMATCNLEGPFARQPTVVVCIGEK